jgi:hypothetical protein
VLNVPHPSMCVIALFREYHSLSVYARERIAQSSHLITYWEDKSTPNPINIKRKVTQQLCSSAGLVQIRLYNEGGRRLTINMPCRSRVEVLLPASERLEIIVAPHNWKDAAAVFVKAIVCNNRT